jgi:hypothetical protein
MSNRNSKEIPLMSSKDFTISGIEFPSLDGFYRIISNGTVDVKFKI